MKALQHLRMDVRYQLLVLVLLALGLNFNTLFNEYAMDDLVVLKENTLVQQGLAGIPDLLTKDSFYGVQQTNVDLSGGRYRPLALASFALEHELFGNNPFVGHLVNLLLFALLTALLFLVLERHLFKDLNPHLAFFTCLLFVVHPIHTEVIANIKSRDELLATLFLLLSSLSLLRYRLKKSPKLITASLLFFLLALLARESAVPFLGIVPLVSYFFFNESFKKSLVNAWPFALVFLFYLGIRLSIQSVNTGSGENILNHPFLYASTGEAFATKVFILCKYIGLLFFPFPLSCDYGYSQIPYVQLLSLEFMVSGLVLAVLIGYALYAFKKRTLLSFSILFFFLTIFLFSNFVIDIGAPLAERLLFQPSLAFCIVAASSCLALPSRFKIPTSALFLLLLIAFGTKTVLRNREWKNNYTLYSADVEAAPNSVRTNMYAAAQHIVRGSTEKDPTTKAEHFRKAVFFDERAISMYSHYPSLYEDLGVAYYSLGNYLKAADAWLTAFNLKPGNAAARERTQTLSKILYKEGNKYFKQGNTAAAITFYSKSVLLNEENADAWYQLGGCYIRIRDTKNALDAWQNVLRLDPNRPLRQEDFQSN